MRKRFTRGQRGRGAVVAGGQAPAPSNEPHMPDAQTFHAESKRLKRKLSKNDQVRRDNGSTHRWGMRSARTTSRQDLPDEIDSSLHSM